MPHEKKPSPGLTEPFFDATIGLPTDNDTTPFGSGIFVGLNQLYRLDEDGPTTLDTGLVK